MASYYQGIDVLLNGHAGKQNATAATQVSDAFRAIGSSVRVRVVDGAALAQTATDAIKSGSTTIVAAGGDGTVSTVAAAVAGTGATLGVIPLGTLNHFAKDIGIPLDLAKAVETIVAGRTMAVDVGDLNGRSFVNNASVGMYASLISERAALQRDGLGKWVAHAFAAMRVWRRYRHLRVVLHAEAGAQTVRTPFVFVGNNEYQLSGIELGGRKDLAGGRLHVCMAPGLTRGGVARLIVTAMFGDVCSLDGFESFTTPELGLDAGVPSIHATVDGEVVPMTNPLTFRIRPGALQVIVP
jgi:diacylglycerol kinase family enzyme